MFVSRRGRLGRGLGNLDRRIPVAVLQYKASIQFQLVGFQLQFKFTQAVVKDMLIIRFIGVAGDGGRETGCL